MSPETLFQIVNSYPMLGWMLLIFAPGWKYTRWIVLYGIMASLAIVYIWLIISYFDLSNGGGFMSLDQVSRLFNSPYAILAGWIHYLAFDLGMGLVIATNALQHGINRWLVAVCLLFTLMLGPFGMLLYLLLRYAKTRRLMAHFP
jgi:hypothetical protein